jgi:ferredoxin--NADP+ reductase
LAKIVKKRNLAERIDEFVVEAPFIARKGLPGQFVIVRTCEEGERFPLTLSEIDREHNTVTLVVQDIGASTHLMCKLAAGDDLLDIAGPLGRPTEIERVGTVVSIGGGVGIGFLRPQVRAFKEAGNRVITIIGARSENLLILEDEMRAVSDEVRITTDDGTKGRHGFVTDELKALIEQEGIRPDLVFAIGPLPMMRFVSEVTRPYGIKTIVSLNPIMIDATGMCGVCRVSIDGQTKFGCVDGPEFDGHLGDYDQLQARLCAYVDKERIACEHVGRPE